MLPAVHADVVAESDDSFDVIRILARTPAFDKAGEWNVVARKQVQQGGVTPIQWRIGAGYPWSLDDAAIEVSGVAKIVECEAD